MEKGARLCFGMIENHHFALEQTFDEGNVISKKKVNQNLLK